MPVPTAFKVSVTDNESTAATSKVTFTGDVVAAGSPLQMEESSVPSGTQGDGYSAQLLATGGEGPVAWSGSSGALPDGLSLDPLTGEITGVPTATGTFDFTAEVQDSSAPPRSVSEPVSVSVVRRHPLRSLPRPFPDATEGSEYFQVIAGSGGVAPYTWTVSSGTLPDGLSLDPATGVISGNSASPGTYPFQVTLTDSATPSADSEIVNLSITVDAKPPASMTVSDTTTATTVAANYQASIIPSGGVGPYSFNVSSGLCPPVCLSTRTTG